MLVAMSLGALLAFGQIVLALVLLYICGLLLHIVRQAQPSAITSRRERR